MFPVELTGPRVVARDWTLEDLDALVAAGGEENVFGYEPLTTRDEAGRFLRVMLEHARAPDRTRYRLAVALGDTGELIGGVRVHIEQAYDLQGSLGYGFLSRHRGQGYATEAAGLVLDLGFDGLGLHRIEALVEPSNERSIAVCERLGMRREGHLRHRIRDGKRWLDTLVFAILADEWRAR